MKGQSDGPTADQQRLLEGIRVRVATNKEQRRCNALLEEHHYLGGIRPVGEQIWYVAADEAGEWQAVLVFSSAAKHLRHRDRWIGWTEEQRRRRLRLVANNARFCVLRECPNLATRVMRLTLDRLAEDWRSKYGHPVQIVESFVDPQRFLGTAYRAGGWTELGQTSGYGRCRKDYYIEHEQPKVLYVRELRRRARRSLQAEHLKPALAMVERDVAVRCTLPVRQIESLVEHFKAVPDFRGRIESYPLWSLLGIVGCAHLCGAPRGQKDLAAFARRMTQWQRAALGIRQNAAGKYPSPSQPTFCRLLQQVDALKVEKAILDYQEQLRGPCTPQELVVMDGKELRHGRGQQILTAMAVERQYYMGSRPVSEKTNEIPVAQQLIPSLNLEGHLVSLDALHTQKRTARRIVQEAGADYLLTVKKNQKTLYETLAGLFTATPAAFSPSAGHDDAGDQPK